MTQVVENLDGWYALNDFREMDWNAWASLSADEKQTAIYEASAWATPLREQDADNKGAFGLYEIAGHKADFMFLHLQPQFESLAKLEKAFDKTALGRCTKKTYSYVSIVELSNYVHDTGSNPYENDRVKARLYPKLPETKHLCFYPMNKKRDGEDNWYSLPFEKRQELMKAHGMTGRSFSGQVTQMITGSTGLDEWEWGVTLFSDDAKIFKKVVYKMRFDEVSAKYGEFGDFYVGTKSDGFEELLS